ncbi:MAG: hypothetical protein R2853_19160 [Thermomicrobiales bacterium]
MTDMHQPGIPDSELTEQQRATLTSLRDRNADLLDAFSKALASLGVKGASGRNLRVMGFTVLDSETLPPESPDGLCCICCPDGTFCCHGSTCSGCCPTHS